MNPKIFKIVCWLILIDLAALNFYFYGDFKTIAVFVLTFPLVFLWLVIFICSFFIIRKAALRKFSTAGIIFLLLIILLLGGYSIFLDNISAWPTSIGNAPPPGKMEMLMHMFKFTWPITIASIFILFLPALGKIMVKKEIASTQKNE